jgi:hypothetical protein
MRKHWHITLHILVLVFFCFSCSDSSDNDEQEKVRDQEIRDFLNSVSQLDTMEEFSVIYKSVLDHTENDVYRYDENDRKWDYYTPQWIRTRISGLEAISNMSVSQSGDVIWPGNIIQGKSVAEGNLAPIPLGFSRKPGRIYLNVVSGQDMQYYRELYTFTGSEVIQAMNDIMAEHTHGLPADVKYIQKTVYNEEEMAYHLDMNNDEFKTMTGGAFSKISWEQKKTRVMVQLVQVYFQMVYEFNGMHEVFKDNIRVEDLRPYVSQGNPMCYIPSVSYGRYFILLYESNETYERLTQAINRTFNRETDDPLTNEDVSIMRNATVTLRQIGDDADAGIETISGDAEKIRNFVIKGATATKDNVGAPIFYSLRYLGNALPVRTYKDIDSEITTLEYVRVKKMNDVRIEIKDIRSNALYLTGGNYSNISNKSKFSVSNIKVEVLNGNTVVKSDQFDPKIQNIGATSNFQKSCSHIIDLGILGENTTNRVKISYSVTYYAKRYGSGWFGGSSDGGTKKIDVVAIYEFNARTEKWEKTSSDMYNTIIDMNSMRVSGSVDHCGFNFRLNYSLSANRETY